jgi:hypothetical protein
MFTYLFYVYLVSIKVARIQIDERLNKTQPKKSFKILNISILFNSNVGIHYLAVGGGI